MTEEEQEEIADRFYLADAWFHRQGELVGWLWTQDRPSEAVAVEDAAKKSLDLWPHPFQVDLFNTFIYSKLIKERQVGWAPVEVDLF